MQRTATLIQQHARAPAVSGWCAWLRSIWKEFALSDDERFLCEARDPVEVEWRMKRLERGRSERFGPLDPSA
jgi:hypothetical protein